MASVAIYVHDDGRARRPARRRWFPIRGSEEAGLRDHHLRATDRIRALVVAPHADRAAAGRNRGAAVHRHGGGRLVGLGDDATVVRGSDRAAAAPQLAVQRADLIAAPRDEELVDDHRGDERVGTRRQRLGDDERRRGADRYAAVDPERGPGQLALTGGSRWTGRSLG